MLLRLVLGAVNDPAPAGSLVTAISAFEIKTQGTLFERSGGGGSLYILRLTTFTSRIRSQIKPVSQQGSSRSNDRDPSTEVAVIIFIQPSVCYHVVK